MLDPYVGQIEAFAFTYAPQGWAMCDGRLLNVRDNEALFSLIGTTYGGDGQNTFGLPDLRGRGPVHTGRALEGGINYEPGQFYGNEKAKLTGVPSHTHNFMVSSGTTLTSNPNGASLGAATIYSKNKMQSTVELAANTIGPAQGAGEPFSIMQPFLAVNWCISLNGTFPEQH